MDYDTAVELKDSQHPAYWFYRRPRKILIQDVFEKGSGLSASAMFKVLWRGHRIELEDAPLHEIYTTEQECMMRNKI